MTDPEQQAEFTHPGGETLPETDPTHVPHNTEVGMTDRAEVMTPDEHAAEARALLDQANTAFGQSAFGRAQSLAAIAQVHATLSLRPEPSRLRHVFRQAADRTSQHVPADEDVPWEPVDEPAITAPEDER
jgi:hypothetical protein